MKKWVKIFLTAIVSVILVVSTLELWNIYSPSANNDRLRVALNLKDLPKSIHGLKCPPSYVMTDFIIKCSFKVDPSEFKLLLDGWPFKEVNSTWFVATPATFKNGGEIKVTSDTNQSEVKVVYYEE